MSELARDSVTEVGRADLRDRQTAGRNHDLPAADRTAVGVELETCVAMPHSMYAAGLPACHPARGALAQQHRDDVLGAVVAKQLPLVFLVPRDAVTLHQVDEILGCVA